MSAFERELLERIDGDGAQSAARWLIELVASGALDWPDMSPFEREFWKQIVAAYRSGSTK